MKPRALNFYLFVGHQMVIALVQKFYRGLPGKGFFLTSVIALQCCSPFLVLSSLSLWVIPNKNAV